MSVEGLERVSPLIFFHAAKEEMRIVQLLDSNGNLEELQTVQFLNSNGGKLEELQIHQKWRQNSKLFSEHFYF